MGAGCGIKKSSDLPSKSKTAKTENQNKMVLAPPKILLPVPGPGRWPGSNPRPMSMAASCSVPTCINAGAALLASVNRASRELSKMDRRDIRKVVQVQEEGQQVGTPRSNSWAAEFVDLMKNLLSVTREYSGLYYSPECG